MTKSLAYKSEIIKELFFHDELSVGDIALITQKSFPVVGKLLNDLIDQGLIVEKGYAISTGGRRPQMFSLAQGAFYIIAVAVDQHGFQAALVDVQRKISGDVGMLSLDLKGNGTATESLISFINDFIQNKGIPLYQIAGIGIGMPGFVDAEKGINLSYFREVKGSLSNYISEKTGLPVSIDNDSSIMGLAELRMGAAKNRKNSMIINIGWGIGLGMIINGKIFRGDNGFAGEFSHIPLFMSNKICDCGKAGCLEAEASLYVVAEKAIAGVNAGTTTVLKDLSFDHIQETTNKILTAAVKGDKFAVELLSETAFNIGRGVAILIHIINPNQIILTGRGAVAGKLWIAPMQQSLNMYCIPILSENTTIEISALGYEAGLMGAAALVMENLDTEFLINKTIKQNI